MSLSNDLIDQFVKVTKDDTSKESEITCYGTVVIVDNSTRVRLDGSSLLTPVITTSNVVNGERVAVMIKNHTAVITGNISSPAARTAEVEEVNEKITTFNKIIADKVSTSELEAQIARINTLYTDKVNTSDLNAQIARINTLYTDKVGTSELNAQIARIDSLSTKKLDADWANINFANIDKAVLGELYSSSGIIKDIVVENGSVTGNLVGVKINGDLIEANTLIANKLVIQGDDGLYYKLNTDGVKIEAQQTNKNSLDGSIITAKSITATKVNVSDLVAFGATIGGFQLTENAIHSLNKNGVNSSSNGIYLDKDGQFVFGDNNYFIKYYKDSNNQYKISASIEDITFGIGKKSLVDEFENLEVGGRNLISGTSTSEISLGGYPSSGYSEGETGSTINVPDKNEYVLSFDAKSTVSGDTIVCHFYSPNTTTKVISSTGWNGSAVDGKAEVELTDSWKRYWVKYTQNGASTNETKKIIVGRRQVGLGSGSVSIRSIKLEEGHIPSDWTPAPEDVTSAISDASKTATNYLNMSSSGLIVGNMTASTLGNNVLIRTDGIDIRNNESVLASFEKDLINLGWNSKEAVIALCGGIGNIHHYNTDDYLDWNRMVIQSRDSIGLASQGEARIETYYVDGNNNIVDCSLYIGADTPWTTEAITDPVHLKAKFFGKNVDSLSEMILTKSSLLLSVDYSNRNNFATNPLIKVACDETIGGYIEMHADDMNVYVNHLTLAKNNAKIRGIDNTGVIKEAFQAQNENNNTVVGWGNYDKESGNTNIYGNDVSIYSAKAGKVGFRPYYRKGDYIENFGWTGSGYISSSGKKVIFTFPLAKAVIGKPPVNASSYNGIKIRQNNSYLYGSAASTYVLPSSYSATLSGNGNHVRIEINMDNTTNVTNNSTCGVEWSGSIFFDEVVG